MRYQKGTTAQACCQRIRGGREDTIRTVRQQTAGQVYAYQDRTRWAEQELAVL